MTKEPANVCGLCGTLFLNYTIASALAYNRGQRRIFIFGALRYFKLGALLEDLRRLMSYKLALHVLVTFTEQVVPIHKRITFF